LENVEVRNHLEDLGEDRRIILKRALRNSSSSLFNDAFSVSQTI
jgi:hypothetical protein